MSFITRGAATLAGAALVGSLAAVLPSTSASAATTDPTPAKLAAAWMVKNLNSDGLLTTSSEYMGQVYSGPSYGSTIDLGMGLATMPGHDAPLSKITSAIAANLAAYTSYEDALYSGSSAKALAFAVSRGQDGHNFGGTDLIARVEGMAETTAPAVGRLRDQDPTPDQWWADYANSIGQAFAANALTAVGSTRAPDVTNYLLAQQCSAGFFRLEFSPSGAADQSCDGAVPAPDPVQGPDTTALVVIQLAPMANSNPAVRSAVNKAANWLAAQQKPNGSFADPVNGVNANTTGLAAQALGAAGKTAEAAKAAVWLRGLQVVGACESKLRHETGAVAYNSAGYAEGQKYGIGDPLDRSQWIIADAQILGALRYAPATATADAVSGPAFVQKGKAVKLTVKGLAPGERACVGTKLVTGTGTAATVWVTATNAAALTLKTATSTKAPATKVLAPVKLALQAPKTAKKGTKVKVTVKKLAAGEKVTLKLRGKKVAAGKATKAGRFVARIKVGARKGKAALTVTGQYATRAAKRTIAVR